MNSRRLQGNAEDADYKAGDSTLPDICKKFSRSTKKHIWNAKETGLNLAIQLNGKTRQSARHGQKKDKTRLNLFVCDKATVSARCSVLLTGNARTSRCFSEKSGAELGFNYTCKSGAQINMFIFIDWLKHLVACIASKPERKNVGARHLF